MQEEWGHLMQCINDLNCTEGLMHRYDAKNADPHHECAQESIHVLPYPTPELVEQGFPAFGLMA